MKEVIDHTLDRVKALEAENDILRKALDAACACDCDCLLATAGPCVHDELWWVYRDAYKASRS